MASLALSSGEKTFILHGIDANFRNDGRSRCEYRSMEVETGVMPQANGSARLRLGNSDVVASVKFELDTPHASKPNEGKLEFYVDCCANATPDFEGKGGDDLASEISTVLMLAYRAPGAFDLEELCILPHVKCWKVYVDVLILQCGGNLFDAVGAVVKSALYAAEMPRVTAAALDGGEADIQLTDDPHDCIKLNTTNQPIIFTLTKVGENFIIDPTLEEEMCSTSSIVISVLPSGRISSINKLGHGSLHSTTLVKTLKVGLRSALALNEILLNSLHEDVQCKRQSGITGFLR